MLTTLACPGDDHPGPNNKVGRGAPEIDILEAQGQDFLSTFCGRHLKRFVLVDYHGYGTASQSVQIVSVDLPFSE